MTRLTVTLTDEHLDVIDRLMRGSGQYTPDRRSRREAIPSLLVDYDRSLHETVRLERQLRDLVCAIDSALSGSDRNGHEGRSLVHRVCERLREHGIRLPDAASASLRRPDRRTKAPRS